LLSIDPSHYDADGRERPPINSHEPHIGDYRILGENAIATDLERKAILAEVLSIVAHGNAYRSRMCFEPRHDVRCKFKEKIYDILICYACNNMAVLIDGQQQHFIHINGSPGKFNAILNAANIPLPKQSH
jgi:hypothetical protein